jgi:hypothetical protein
LETTTPVLFHLLLNSFGLENNLRFGAFVVIAIDELEGNHGAEGKGCDILAQGLIGLI